MVCLLLQSNGEKSFSQAKRQFDWPVFERNDGSGHENRCVSRGNHGHGGVWRINQIRHIDDLGIETIMGQKRFLLLALSHGHCNTGKRIDV